MTRTVTMKGNLGSEQTTRVPSPAIWGDCPWEEIANGMRSGILFWDDFVNQPTWTAGTGTTLKYSYYGDTGVTINAIETYDESGGVLEICNNDADNDEGSIQCYGAPFEISDTAGADFKLWFEARLKKAAITDNSLAFFVGLSEEGLAAADTLVDNTGVMADKDYIGFDVEHDAGEELNFGYNLSGATAVEKIAALDTLVADTYVKVGFVYDPLADTAKRIKVFLNGIEQSTYVTATNIATASGSAFPDGEELAPLLATKVGTAAESALHMDWWRCCQLSN